jgi:hypothetical protein
VSSYRLHGSRSTLWQDGVIGQKRIIKIFGRADFYWTLLAPTLSVDQVGIQAVASTSYSTFKFP